MSLAILFHLCTKHVEYIRSKISRNFQLKARTNWCRSSCSVRGLRPAVTSTETAWQWSLNCQYYISWKFAGAFITEQTDRENILLTAHQKCEGASKRRTRSYTTRRRNFVICFLTCTSQLL